MRPLQTNDSTEQAIYKRGLRLRHKVSGAAARDHAERVVDAFYGNCRARIEGEVLAELVASCSVYFGSESVVGDLGRMSCGNRDQGY